MTIFGDQSWKKIQRFLVHKEGESTDITYRSVKGIQSKIYQLKPEIEREVEYMKELHKRQADSSGLRIDTMLNLKGNGEQLLTPKDESNDEKLSNTRSPLLEGFSGRKPTALFMTKRVNKEWRDSFELDNQYQ